MFHFFHCYLFGLEFAVICLISYHFIAYLNVIEKVVKTLFKTVQKSFTGVEYVALFVISFHVLTVCDSCGKISASTAMELFSTSSGAPVTMTSCEGKKKNTTF